jgi:hypothetical protein
MKTVKRLILNNHIRLALYGIMIAAGSISLKGCLEPPEFDFVPEISFNSVRFYNVTESDPTSADTLVISINFRDGDGDLGLRRDDVNPPFHPFDFALNETGERITYAMVNRTPRFNNFNYVIDSFTFRNQRIVDTFLINRNENHFNIIVNFYRRRAGQWEFLDLAGEPFFSTFNGRFPILNTENYPRPLEGVISYKMVSAGFTQIFRIDSLRVEVFIKDRALNNSNTITTPAFTLPQVRAN